MHIFRRSDPLSWFTCIAAAGVGGSLYVTLVYAQTDPLQGPVQRLFYFHLASFWAAFVGFAITACAGIAYLRTRQNRWDRLALAGAEVGFVLSIVTVVSGSIWARPVWNTWWTWDPRLTATAVMMLTYAAYLMLRSGITNPDHRRLFSSVYGILALPTVIFSIVVIRVRPDTMFPVVFGPGRNSSLGLTPEMSTALMFTMLVWCGLLTPALIWWRFRLET